MSELGDTFREWREYKKKKKAKNLEFAPDILHENGIRFKALTMEHYRIGEYDFWPTTGLYIHRKTKKRGRGVFNLIKALTPPAERMRDE